METTVNELLVLTKAVRERLNGLKQLRGEVSKKEHYFGSDNKVVEPQYDVKAVDVKITHLETFLFKADAAIKKSNAVTIIDLDYSVDDLLSPLQ